MPVPDEQGKHKRSLLRDQAYVSIRDAIIGGTLAPGEKLRDPELENWLGISRTPIREALARLEASGLVHTVPGRSTVVSTIERKAVFDAQALAATMHGLAVRIAVPLMGKGEIAAMVDANKDFAAAFAAGGRRGGHARRRRVLRSRRRRFRSDQRRVQGPLRTPRRSARSERLQRSVLTPARLG